MRSWRAANPERQRRNRAAWYARNKDTPKFKACQGHNIARRLAKNPNLWTDNSRRFRAKNPGKWKEYQEKSAYKNRQHFLYVRLRARAKQQGIAFDLAEADISWPTHCPVFGIELQYDRRGATSRDNAPSFDRVNPDIGYLKGNVYVVSSKANRIKAEATLEQLEALARYVRERLPV